MGSIRQTAWWRRVRLLKGYRTGAFVYRPADSTLLTLCRLAVRRIL
jgi:hypothetical protein